MQTQVQSLSRRRLCIDAKRCRDLLFNEIDSHFLIESALSRSVAACFAADSRAWAACLARGRGVPVVAHYYAELVSFFARSLNSRDAAADVVQESYARVFAMQSRELAVRDLRALLFRTGKNIVIDDARRRAAEARMLETLAVVGADEVPSAERQVQGRQQLVLLSRRLQAMPRKRREVFVLVRIYGFSHAEAAAHMNISEAAIEKHVVRAVCDCMGLKS
nr:sigma-70 family RNA polymerase sigma factor [Comamonas thiooxydans]